MALVSLYNFAVVIDDIDMKITTMEKTTLPILPLPL